MKSHQISLKTKGGNINLERFAGEWVALVEDKIVSHNKTLKDLMKGMKKHLPRKKPSVLLVPRKEEGPYIL
ncbi:MAG: hypothetical protein COX46_02690 [bacterium (Candidatus Ratteibacteria) CG23_combo_of_CG06-09_8_20_14_all_48_7]|uniref:DUF5678 domain-containing protein n=1 Tax=bacterium (Candidatus Ratteibacteria) CG23_combo_of_CG06-09_8_20_14_all_48_7 TaxID=2014292 RepID=A0A2G9YAX3_9BACT|nr:MAG: hypothetical protein COX46_02690 [bacterium (Candidatus Ratteibacteria) CG23_combo_of_CG06-09_8_20_14_all_48_7]